MAESDREHWDARYREASQGTGPEPDWLAAFAAGWPGRGRALDVAAGRGRIALWLARRGLGVLAADVSPVGLEQAREAAWTEGLGLDTRVIDLERESLPGGPFDVITCFHYLQRDLFPALIERLAPGGCLCVEIATTGNLERHAHPSRRFLLEPGELARLCAPLELVHSAEGWFDDRCVARLVGRRVS
jgi:2-polyprenyl-3-methyl-5-hydroxy-6-metoxy-1,4-benzoquinol methylase